MIGWIIVGVVVLAVVMLFTDTKPGALLKGFWGLFFEDMAKTPDGAKAIFAKALDDATDRYTKAKNNLSLVAGKTNTSERRLAEFHEALKACETRCETFAANGDEEHLRLYAEQRQSIVEDIKLEEKNLAELKPLLEQAKKIAEALAEQIRNLEREKTRVIAQLELGKDMKQVYDSMDSLASDSEIKKLLKASQDGAAAMQEQVAGAKLVHEERLTTKLENADKAASKAEADNYIQALRAKHQK